jgi:hypothetical protein
MMTREIFADEIAIDFPAVDHLVERVRDGFLGEPDPEMVTTEVSLSAAEAAAGAAVPLDIPLRGLCADCGGRGETWSEPCASCAGSGNWITRRSLTFSVPPGAAGGRRFRFRVSSPHAASVTVEVRVAIRNF